MSLAAVLIRQLSDENSFWFNGQVSRKIATQTICERRRSWALAAFSNFPLLKNAIFRIFNQVDPVRPTGQFLAPKLIILIQCLIVVLFFNVLF